MKALPTDPCRGFRDALSARLDGELEDGAALALHLRACAACREHEATLRELEGGWRELRELAPPPELWPRIARTAAGVAARRAPARTDPALARGPAARATRSPGVGIARAAALVGFLAVGVLAAALERAVAGSRHAPTEHPPALAGLLPRARASAPDDLLAAVPEYRLLRRLARPEDDR